jgi:hypothetical protein
LLFTHLKIIFVPHPFEKNTVKMRWASSKVPSRKDETPQPL